MIKAINHEEILTRGALLCGCDDFVFVRCISCNQQYLYNQEDLKLYLDPEDLSDYELNIESESDSACTGCGRTNWDFEELEESDLSQVKDGSWAWAL